MVVSYRQCNGLTTMLTYITLITLIRIWLALAVYAFLHSNTFLSIFLCKCNHGNHKIYSSTERYIEDEITYHRFMIMEYFSTDNPAIYAHHL